MLPVKVLFDGKFVKAGVEVDVISGEFSMTKGMELPTYKTDEHGIAKVKLERGGVQSLGADHVVSPSMDPQLADVDNYASSLSFVLPTKWSPGSEAAMTNTVEETAVASWLEGS